MATFEESLASLREIVERLERGDLPLEEGVALYKQGLETARRCRQTLEAATVEVAVYQDGLLREFQTEDSGDDGQG